MTWRRMSNGDTPGEGSIIYLARCPVCGEWLVDDTADGVICDRDMLGTDPVYWTQAPPEGE